VNLKVYEDVPSAVPVGVPGLPLLAGSETVER
jgi:hypothetical protein